MSGSTLSRAPDTPRSAPSSSEANQPKVGLPIEETPESRDPDASWSTEEPKVSGETMFWMDHSTPSEDWVYNRLNFAPLRHCRRTYYSQDILAKGLPVVGWIDDRNEAVRLGVSVDDLLASRQVAASLSYASDSSLEDARDVLHLTFPVSFPITVTDPRFHYQLKNVIRRSE